MQLATRMALASKIRDDEVTLIDDLTFDAPKTKDMAAILKAWACAGTSLLVATAEHDVNVYKSARNIDRRDRVAGRRTERPERAGARRVLMTKAALDAVRARAKSQASEREA